MRHQLARYRPTLASPGGAETAQAAVSLILLHDTAQPESPELLFIERAHSERDPWSGQMAFPGGRYEHGDADLAATARRETLEEIGLELGPQIGRVDDTVGRGGAGRRLIVAGFVHEIQQRPVLRANHEVRSTVWIPLPWILAPESAVEYHVKREGFEGRFPAFRYRDHTVWGLTYRLLGNLFQATGGSLPSHRGGG